MSAPIDIDNTFLLCIIILLHVYVWITLSNIQKQMYFLMCIYLSTGVKKNNDTSKRNYFSSNRHDASAEIIRSDYRLEVLKRGAFGHPSCEREETLHQT